MNGFCAEHTRYRIYLHRDTGICKRAVWSEFKSRWGALGSQEDGLRTGMWLSNDGKTIGVINGWTGKGKRRKTPDTELYRKDRLNWCFTRGPIGVPERKELTPKIDPSKRQDMYSLTRGAGNEGKLDCGAEERMGEEVYSQTRLTPIVESEAQHTGVLSGSSRRKADRARRAARVALTGGEMVGISSSISGPPSQRGGWVGNGRESVDRSKVSGGRTITDPGGTIHQLKAWEPGKHNEWVRGMKTHHVGDQMEEASCKSEGERSVSEPGGMQTYDETQTREAWPPVNARGSFSPNLKGGRSGYGEGGRVVVDDGGAMRAGREKSASADQPEAKDLGDTINRKTVEGKEDYRSGKDGSANPEGSVDLSKARQEEGGGLPSGKGGGVHRTIHTDWERNRASHELQYARLSGREGRRRGWVVREEGKTTKREVVLQRRGHRSGKSGEREPIGTKDSPSHGHGTSANPGKSPKGGGGGFPDWKSRGRGFACLRESTRADAGRARGPAWFGNTVPYRQSIIVVGKGLGTIYRPTLHNTGGQLSLAFQTMGTTISAQSPYAQGHYRPDREHPTRSQEKQEM
ncbi:hypothetical protein BJ322DRAFT_1022252 [Thelephora terrestris]|uniref:Uncharacterized protein n=1 Tax=Thelephora terrestris TaxID=56493 RepID=A0A9P6L526_9AGAM|nr:hypothetical protein BJ322DRAFT_1022252 [Thelephora terrestris]